MKLSKLERLLLINQYTILQHLEETDEYDDVITVLRDGYEIHYDTAVDHISPGVSMADCEFVLEVLQMYRAIEDYKRDAKDPEVENSPFSHFAGFDGNNEGSLLSFVRFEIGKDNNWDEQKPYKKLTDGFNSHMSMRQTYERMLAAWKGLGEPLRLSKAQVTTILDAASRADS